MGETIIMDFTVIEGIARKYHCEILYDEPMHKYNTMKVGGNAEALIKPCGISCLSEVIAKCNEQGINYHIIGKGSNIIVSDKGISGLIIVIGEDFSRIELVDENIIECEAGASLSKVCSFAYKNSLTGLEFAWGIPGSVGGAVYMNAGAYDGEMSEVVLSCEQIDLDGNVSTIGKEDMDFSYRHSRFTDTKAVVAVVRIGLRKGDKTAIKARMDELLMRRKTRQPLEYPSSGSTLKRPKGSYASLLIEQCGLKGTSVGGAEVSEKHSGFIINKNDASCEDIKNLVAIVKEKVNSQTGYILDCEMQILED